MPHRRAVPPWPEPDPRPRTTDLTLPSHLSRSTPLARLALTGLVVATCAAPAVAVAATKHARVHAIYSGGRTTDLRVGEPLAVTYPGRKIGRICWNPAPIQADQCGTGFAAPAHAGRQRLELTFADGTTVNTSVRVGRAATALPASRAAVTSRSHAVEYDASCEAPGYANYAGRKRRLSGKADALAIRTGDRLAAYYVAGPGVIQAFGYRSGKPAFYRDGCLTPVR